MQVMVVVFILTSIGYSQIVEKKTYRKWKGKSGVGYLDNEIVILSNKLDTMNIKKYVPMLLEKLDMIYTPCRYEDGGFSYLGAGSNGSLDIFYDKNTFSIFVKHYIQIGTKLTDVQEREIKNSQEQLIHKIIKDLRIM